MPPDRTIETASHARRHVALGDLAVAGVAGAVAITVMHVSQDVSPRPAGAWGAVILAAAGAALMLRRRHPIPVLAAVAACVGLYYGFGFPGGAELPLFAVTLYAVVVAGHRLVGAVATAALTANSLGYRLIVDDDEPVTVVITAGLLVLVLLLGEAVRARRQLASEVEQRLRVVAAEAELEARARRTEDRLQLARELHDVLAHTITTITVQAGAAADGLPEDSEAHRALRTVRATAREATRQLRSTIEVLRMGPNGPAAGSVPGLDDLDDLVRGVGAAGVAVDLEVRGAAQPLPADVELAVHRIVQEALTNVIRHADTDRAHVVVDHLADALVVTVTDDGRGADASPTDGVGLTGMRERARALGGEVTAGPRDGGGFVVRVSLPRPEESA
ncbi:sensor histidine kinase [Nitriliruptoraceae bacterium ZYF776]|nr:sensor histidine kinase [Profundirhabdus halotolerans]